jgi:hypothetical protein
MRTLPMLTRCIAVLAFTGCTQLVEVDDYTFDRDPCGPRPETCPAGGESLTFVIAGSDIPRTDEAGRRNGFDLDGTSDAICGQPDLTDRDGVRGVDNQLAIVLELYESLAGLDLAADNRAAYTRGEMLTLYFLDDYDGPDDDCFEVSYREARLPDGVDIADLDADLDGELDPGLTWNYGPPLFRSPTSCSIDGVIHAHFLDSVVGFLGVGGEVSTQRGRVEMSIDEGGDRVHGMIGGALRLVDLNDGLPAEVVEFLRPRADIYPSIRDAYDCASISFAIDFEAIPALRGAPL